MQAKEVLGYKSLGCKLDNNLNMVIRKDSSKIIFFGLLDRRSMKGD